MIKTGLVLALLLLANSAVFGRTGTLRTRTGITYEGDIRLEAASSLLVLAGTNQPVRVALAEVEQMTLNPDARSETASLPLVAGALPAPWLNRQVGLFGTAGTATFVGGRFIVQGGGAEACQFVYQPIAGNGDLITRISSAAGGEAAAKAGLMARHALTEDSPFLWVAATAAGKGVVLSRATVGKNPPQTASVEFATPGWLKLTRTSNRVSAHTSRDGQKWDLVGAETLLANIPLFIGFAVNSGNSHELNRAVFENVTLNLAPRETAQQAVTLRNGTTLAATIQSVNDVTIKFTSYGRSFSFPMIEVSRLLLRPVAPEKLAALPPGRRGVLLANGDFYDGEITELDGNKVKVNSVLFGPREYSIPKEVAGLVYRDLRSPAMPWLARGSNGTVLQSKSVIPQGDRFLCEDEVVGAFHLPFAELVELKRQRPLR